MKIIHVINGLNLGGTERMLLRLVKSDVFREDEITVISLLGPGKLSDEFTTANVKIVYLNCNSWMGVLSSFFILGALLRREKPHVLHSWLYQSDLLAGLAGKVVGVKKIVWSIRQTNISLEANRTRTWVLIRLAALLSNLLPTFVVANSKEAGETHAKIGYPKSKITVIQNGFETKEFFCDSKIRRDYRLQLGLDGFTPLVGMVARYDVVKNHRGFFEFASLILQKKPQAKFLLCGSKIEKSNAPLVSLAKQTGAYPNCIWLGEQTEDLVRIYNAIDVLVSSSNGESFPSVIAEAMACGTPAIGTDVGATRDIISNPDWVVSKSDMEGLANVALSILSKSEQDLSQISKLVRRRVDSRYNVEVVSRTFRNFYANL